MLRLYLGDLRDESAAIVVLDPKSELSRLCLALTPPDCPKRVWFLDLGHPAFGMSPLRLVGSDPLPLQATAIADNVVAALLDINENQLFQSSRRYLYHAVIGALALAVKQRRRAKFEDVYQLLLPKRADVRDAVYQACADTPDLDQTAEFFRTELPNDLELAGSATAQRLDAPRNKVSLLTGVPPLRRFFNHQSDIALADILDARDILIVDANMATIGAENARACLHFVLRMLHTQLQRQVRRPESDRPRVALLADEAHYLASAENVVDQIATHRAAGLDVTFGLQYFAQLGSGSEHREKIRKGILNLLQSRCLFRLGDHEDAEQATRIAMAVYASMIREDPDSRARLRVTPEQILNLPVHFCLASWIANGTRAPSFIGQTYPLPAPIGDAWAQQHLARLADAVGPYPEALASTLEAPAAPAVDEAAPAPRPTRNRRPQQRTLQPGSHDRPSPLDGRPHGRRRHRRPAFRPRARRHARALEHSSSLPGPASTCGRASHRTDTARARAEPGAARRRPADARRRRRDPARPRPREHPRARLHRPHQRGPPTPAPATLRAAPAPVRRGLRDPRPARPRRPRPALADRPRRPARPRAQDDPPPARQALRARPRRPLTDRPQRPHQRRRPAAVALHDHPPRHADRPGPHPARDPPRPRMARPRTAPRRPPPPRPARPLLGDRVPPRRRQARHRLLAHPALRHRPLPRPPDRQRPQTPPDHHARAHRPRRPRRPRPAAVSRDQARPRARAAHPRARSSPSTCSSSSTSPAAPPTTARSSSPTTPSSPAGRPRTPATGRSAPARPSSSSAATSGSRSPTPRSPTRS